MIEKIRVQGAEQHNLKKIDVSLPRNKFIVITGPSGSGKSSLAFDTLYAEGQRRYIECLSTYARQFIEQLEKPEVELIEGLSPSISIDQKTISHNPRSTVGTITEIHDYLRLLFARAGTPYCPQCGRIIESQTSDQIFQKTMENYLGQKIKILSPIIRGRKGEYHQLLARMRKKGFLRARIDGVFKELEEEIRLEKTKKHTIEILIDEIEISPEREKRIKEAIFYSLDLAEGTLLIIDSRGKERLYSLKLFCPYCEISLPQLEPRNFSFNSPYGACSECNGLGFETTYNEWGEIELTEQVCPACQGQRLKPESLSVKVDGKNIYQLSCLPIKNLLKELPSLQFPPNQKVIAEKILKEIISRLEIMNELGLSYLDLNRPAITLAGGEAQRVRLATQIGTKLRGVMYVLDEPTIGLHQRDNKKLISILKGIRDIGNTIIVVEHDEQTIRAADFILDLGPGAGEQGGYKVAEGSVDDLLSHSNNSLTALYLRKEKFIPIPEKRRQPKGWLIIKQAAEHNLKNIDVKIPLGVMTTITGVSGSGKSTLIYDTLYKVLAKIFYRAKETPGKHKEILGIKNIDKVVSIDQKPIGRTPRSNPATYTGLFTHLRQLFSQIPEARLRGYKPGRFSFNVKGGRCEECRGAGVKRIEMHFLPDVFVTCPRCQGKRYNKETLAIVYKGKNIADYLQMTVDEAYPYLKNIPSLKNKLKVLNQVGLGYIRLGQPAPTLSGGEAQRIKLTKELSRKSTGRTLHILDEPTTGLHFDDVKKLLELLSELVNRGNTIIIIEHNLEVIKFSDYIIDLGPEGGEDGGKIVAQGTPEEVAEVEDSYTGQFLRKILEQKDTRQVMTRTDSGEIRVE
ncbi:MAG: excinuclease ABC subunit UvrA [Candidatus Aminicenantia bacterium]